MHPNKKDEWRAVENYWGLDEHTPAKKRQGIFKLSRCFPKEI